MKQVTENDAQLNLTLSLTELNQIISILVKEPYKEVASLISKISVQGEAQMVAKEESSSKNKD